MGRFDIGEHKMAIIHTGPVEAGDIGADTISAANIAPDAVTKAEYAGGVIKSALINGGLAGDHTVTGIAVGDGLFGVYRLEIDTEDIKTMTDLAGEFVGENKGITGDNTINNTGGTNTTGDQILIFYEDLT